MMNIVKGLRNYIEMADMGWNIAVIDEPTCGWESISQQLDWCYHNPGYSVEKIIPERVWIVWDKGIMREILIDERTTNVELNKIAPILVRYIDQATEYWKELKERQQREYWDNYEY